MSMRPGVHWDSVGFPLIWCPPIGAYVHWLPVTKIQFEHFLCDVPDASFDSGWYESLLALNPRVSPEDVTWNNYWGTLMTGLRPAEAQRFAGWCGDDYRVLREDEWLETYRWFARSPPADLSTCGLLSAADERVTELIYRIGCAVRQSADSTERLTSQASQMLFELGALEWVTTGFPPSAWGVMGEPKPEFCRNLQVPGQPARRLTVDADGSRIAAAGTRLIYEGSPQQGGAICDGSAACFRSEP